MYRAVLFDLDGTLVSTSAAYRYQTTKKALKHFSVTASNDLINQFWFMANRERLIREEFGVNPNHFWEEFRKHDDTAVRKRYTKPFKDVVPVLKELRAAGMQIGLVTGTPDPVASMEIDLIGRDRFDAITIAQRSLGIFPKPYPDGIHHCLQQLRLGPKAAIFAGNSDEDMLSAKIAGVFDILVERGEHPFPYAQPSKTIKSLRELLPMLRGN